MSQQAEQLALYSLVAVMDTKLLNKKCIRSKRGTKWGDSEVDFEALDILGDIAMGFDGRSVPCPNEFYSMLKALDNVLADAPNGLGKVERSHTESVESVEDSPRKKIKSFHVETATERHDFENSISAVTTHEDMTTLDSNIAKFIHCVRLVYQSGSTNVLRYLQTFIQVSFILVLSAPQCILQ